MGSLVHGLFAHHNRDRFEVFAYALADRHDTLTASVQAGVDHYTQVFGWSNGQIAERIRNDRIDVLIDLMGHTHHSRPVVLALRPAPLQLLYLGYPGTLGASWIDGLIADHWLIPAELEHGYCERVLRLPWAFVSSPPPGLSNEAARLPGVGVSRGELGLPEQGAVFACFNRPEKLDPDRFGQWEKQFCTQFIRNNDFSANLCFIRNCRRLQDLEFRKHWYEKGASGHDEGNREEAWRVGLDDLKSAQGFT
jgi:predicted O-linked N-acetylglucosamine transferase (SPINDLY family)